MVGLQGLPYYFVIVKLYFIILAESIFLAY
jgi:hypothetical protein